MDKAFEKDERRIDLGCIRNVDCSIIQILDKSDNVAFYRFEGSAWHKQDIEGSLFVFSRSVSPFYGFVILNRRSLSDNVIELLLKGLEFQRSGLYLLYKTKQQTSLDVGIRSIWFENEGACVRISNLLNRLMRMKKGENVSMITKMQDLPEDEKLVRKKPDSPPKAPAQKKTCERTQGGGGGGGRVGKKSGKKGGNLLDMFSNAHLRYSGCLNDSEPEPMEIPVQTRQKPIKIMKRSDKLEEADIVPDVRPKSDDLSASSSRGVPITFQDLVNSVQHHPRQEKGRPLSCCSLEGGTSMSSASVEETPISTNGDSNSPRSSNSAAPHDTAPTPITTSTQHLPPHVFHHQQRSSLSETKLLLSPLDFQKTSSRKDPPQFNGVDSRAKRTLFTNGIATPTTNPSAKDLHQFKELLIAAIEEDDQLVKKLYGMYQQKVALPAR